MVNLAYILAANVPTVHGTGVNVEQATVTVSGVVVCLIVVLTFAFSRFDKNRKETLDRMDKDRVELTAMVTAIALALGVRLDKVDGKLEKNTVDLAELKGMARISKHRDEKQDEE
jgi:uncharacterized membrane protein